MFVFSFSYSYYVAHVIKKLELTLLLLYVWKIKFEHTQISVLESWCWEQHVSTHGFWMFIKQNIVIWYVRSNIEYTTSCKKLNISVSGFKTWRTNTTDSSILKPEVKTFLVLRKAFSPDESVYTGHTACKNLLFINNI